MKNIKKQIILITLTLITVLISVSACSAATINVGPTGDYQDIKNAVGNASANDTIIVANGIYSGENNTGITINKNLIITGTSKTGTIIDAQGANNIFSIASGYTVTISKLTLKNGRNSDSGGAIYNQGTCTVTNCNFTDNKAIGTKYNSGGGAIYNEGKITVTGCTFTGNNAEISGGAIYNNEDGNLTVTNCNFTDNEAINSDGGAIRNMGLCIVTGSTFTGNTANDCCGGGAIMNEEKMTITSCTFKDNAAYIGPNYYDAYGGAIYNYDTMTITGCTFISNTGYLRGGAIYNYEDCILDITGCTFTNNTVESFGSGGAVYNYYGNCTVKNCNFTGNEASNEGGAIYNDEDSTMTITGSSFTSNVANEGGAICNYGNCNITGCTFTNNTLTSEFSDGGAILNYKELTVTDSIFKNNSAGYGGAIESEGNANIIRCIFTGNIAGDEGGAVYSYEHNLTIIGCNFYNNTATETYGGAILCGSRNNDSVITIKYSRFVGNNAGKAGQDIMQFDGLFDARYNWWGSNDGPAIGRLANWDNNIHQVVNLSSNFYDPWLVLNIYADPTTIYTGKTSKITANVYMDSNSTDHSADASQFFSGPEMTFTTDWGNVGSKSVTVPWTLGTAFATLRGDEGPGLATVTATDANTTLSTTVTILQAPTVEAASEEGTVGMQQTGLPLPLMVLAVLMVLGGILTPKRK